MNILLILFIISFFFQSFYSKKKYGYVLNPIFIFNVIFFFHNWSLAFTQLLNESFINIVIPNNSYSIYKNEILIINLTCLWSFFFGIILINKKKNNKDIVILYNFDIYNKLYYLLFFYSLVYGYYSGLFTKVYGFGQYQNPISSFSPMGIFMVFRYIFGSICILVNNKRTKYIIVIELIFSLLTGGRKNLVTVLIAFMISKYEFIKFNIDFRKIIAVVLSVIFVAYFVVFISDYRSFKHEYGTAFFEKLVLTNNIIMNEGRDVVLSFLSSADSEGVQAWTLSLLNEGLLDKTNGLSYLQAVVNTVVLRPFQGDLINYQAAFYFKRVAYPGIKNHGWDYSFSAEAILNWGYFAFLSYLLLGLIIGWIYKKREKNQYYYIMYGVVMSTLFINLRTDSTSLLRVLSIYVITFFLFRIFNLIKKHMLIRNEYYK